MQPPENFKNYRAFTNIAIEIPDKEEAVANVLKLFPEARQLSLLNDLGNSKD